MSPTKEILKFSRSFLEVLIELFFWLNLQDQDNWFNILHVSLLDVLKKIHVIHNQIMPFYD